MHQKVSVSIEFEDRRRERVPCADPERAFEIFAQAIQMAKTRGVRSISVVTRDGTKLSEWSKSDDSHATS